MVEKWNDPDNYTMYGERWERMLQMAEKHHDVMDVRRVIAWFLKKRINRTWNLDYIAAYGFVGISENVETELRKFHADENQIAKIKELIESSSNLDEYTILVMKEFTVPEEIIEEFRTRD